MSQSNDTLRSAGLSTGRLEALSDGVLAIVITLLVLGFADADKGIAGSPKMTSWELISYLTTLWPHLLGYVLSFVLIAVYWIMHHVMFHHIRRADRGLLWLNLLFLMSVAFLPFPTDLLAECIQHESNVIVLLYGISHEIAGLSLAGVWWYATHRRRLVAADLSPALVRTTMAAVLAGPALYAAGAAVSFWSIPGAIGVYALAPLLYIVPVGIDRVWLTLSHGDDGSGSPTRTIRELIGDSRPLATPPRP